MVEIYESREDTFLILKEIKYYATGNVLDMGTGSGVLALEAAKTADYVFGADINDDALEYARAKAENLGIRNAEFVHSDLFSYFKIHPLKFDLIIFNPPYLPEDEKEPPESALATTGGKKVYETLERFFSEASYYLNPFGKILVVFSTLTGKDKLHSIMESYSFNFQKLAEESFFAETLFVYVAEKSELLKSLEAKGITHVKKLSKGHRGIIFTGKLLNVKVAVKKQREDIQVIGRIENEARWLKVLNRKGIGPKILFVEDGYFIYEFVEGEFLPDYLEKASKENIKKVFTDVFKQCFVLDQRGISKEEMHHPLKHVLVKNNKAVLIDFERTHATEKPQNVTQFCQYVSGVKVLKLLQEKGFKFTKTQITMAAKRYKKDINEKNFKEIINALK